MNKKPKTIMLFGTFDLIHRGHIELFKQAKRKAEKLIVVIARDSRVKKLKGKQTIHTEQERKQLIQSIKYVDQAILGGIADVYKVIQTHKPSLIGLGHDQTHFTKELSAKLQEFKLDTRIIRLQPYKPTVIKSNKLRTAILDSL